MPRIHYYLLCENKFRPRFFLFHGLACHRVRIVKWKYIGVRPKSRWRIFECIKPPVMELDTGPKAVESRLGWLNWESPEPPADASLTLRLFATQDRRQDDHHSPAATTPCSMPTFAT